MADTIWAQKGEQKKKFKKRQWDLLPVDKKGLRNGYKALEATDQIVSDSIVKKAPESGTKKPDAPVVKKPGTKKQVAENTAEAKKDSTQTVDDSVATKKAIKAFDDQVKEHLTRTTIKDYFDKEDIKYKSSAKLGKLTDILHEKFGNSIDDLNEAFNISEL